MYHLFLYPVAKGGMIVVSSVTTHVTITHLALLYANHAVSTVGAAHVGASHAVAGHVAAGHAAAGHAGRAMPAGHHPGTHPAGKLIDDFALSAGATVAALTFTNLYDHMLDELWATAQDHLSAEDLREQMRHLAFVACRHTRSALRRVGKLTSAEAARLTQLREQLLARLQSMPLGGLAAAA